MYNYPIESLLNSQEEDSLWQLSNRRDSCPPTPHNNEDSSSGIDFSEIFGPNQQPQIISCFAPKEKKVQDQTANKEKVTVNNKEVAPATGKIKQKIQRKCNTPSKTEKRYSAEEKKAIRAEKNRQFAKQSRDRKRKYVQDLELQVDELKKTVEYYKEKLRKYESVEKANNTIGYELYDYVAKVHKIMQENNQPFTDEEFFRENLKNIFIQNLEERKATLKMLVKEIVEVSIPFSIRLSLWCADQGHDDYNLEMVMNLISLGGQKITLDQAKELVGYTKQLYPDKKLYAEMQLLLKTTGKNILHGLKEIVKNQKQIKNELQKYHDFLSSHVYTKYKPYMLEAYAKITPQLATKPEIRNYVLTQVNDIDLGFQNLSIGKDDKDHSKEESSQMN